MRGMRLGQLQLKWLWLGCGLLLLVLALVAALQYRWINQMSDSDRRQRLDMLDRSARNLRREFSETVYEAMRLLRQSATVTPGTDLESGLKDFAAQWPSIAERPQLLGAIGYAVMTSDGRLVSRQLQMDGKQFIAIPWPVELTQHREFLEKQRRQPATELPAAIRGLRGELIASRPVILFPLLALREGPPAGALPPIKGWGILELNDGNLKTQFLPELVFRHFGRSGLENYLLAVLTGADSQILYQPDFKQAGTGALFAAVDARIAIFGNQVLPPLMMPGPPEEGRPSAANRPQQMRRPPRRNGGPPGRFPPWMNGRPPANAPWPPPGREGRPPGASGQAPPGDDLSFDRPPRLDRPPLNGSLEGRPPQGFPPFPDRPPVRRGPPADRGSLIFVRLARGEAPPADRAYRRRAAENPDAPGTPQQEPLVEPEAPNSWQLVVKYKSGSLEQTVHQTRRRNLAFSFGALLILSGSIALLALTAFRSRKLAAQQMEFVAGVSHELRTPLAVIQSTSYNLAKGMIADPRRVQQYGEVIQNESRRLTQQVEQMLSFAGIQSGRQHYDLRPVRVEEIIEHALAEYAAAFAADGWQVEKRIEPELPLVMADTQALESAVKNLLQNALKYAASGKYLSIRAEAKNGNRDEIQITIADHGSGIDANDLPHIFKPFYRGKKAWNSPAPGTGLGLSLVERHLQAHGGRVTVKSSPGGGTQFTLHLPVPYKIEQQSTVDCQSAGDL
jgi:signal transduction histidine kinase